MTSRKIQTVVALLLLLSLMFAMIWPVSAQEQDRSKTAPRAEFPGGIPVAAGEAFKAGELLVKFQDGAAVSSVTEALDRYNAIHLRTLLDGQVQLWQVPEGQETDIAAALEADPAVEYAEPNYRYYAVGVPNDPDFGKQWGHTLMQSTQGWDVTTGSSGLTIAIIDTGIDPGHPDLASKLVAGYDFVDGDSNPTDTNGHGTHVAGISAAVTNNGVGVAGMDWNARIMPIRVLNTEGSGYTSAIVDGIYWAYGHGARVLNMSLGGPTYSSAMQAAVNAAHGAGNLVVAAMGNDNVGTPFYPAAYDNVLAVAAVGPSDTKSSFSNYGSHCDVAAPGGDMSYYHDPAGIYSTMPTYPVYLTTAYSYYQNYDYLNGTSQASPYVAGLAALVWAVQPGLTPNEVQTIIQDTADDKGAPGWDQYYGHGRVNVGAALQQGSPPAAPTLNAISNPDGDGNYLVDWTDAPTANSYTLQEDDNAGFSSPNNLYTGATSQFNVSGKGPGWWYYRVKATNDAGDSGWSNVAAVLVKPNAPTLNAINNPGNDDAYTVSWSAATAASGYTLQEDDNASFSSPRTRYLGAATSYNVTGQPGGTWYYRVQAHNSAGSSGWSNTQSVTVDPLPYGPPNLLAISNPDGDGHYLVDWSDVTGATGYLLERSDNPYFVNPAQVYSGAASQFSATNQSNGHWYYRARATGPSGSSPWSNERDVVVTTYVFLPAILRKHTAGSDNYGLPFCEGFEGGLVPPAGWTRIQTNPRQTWKIKQMGTPYEGAYAADVEYDDQLAYQNEILLSPEFTASSAQLQFYSLGSLYWCRDTYDNCDLNVWLVVGGWGGGDDIFVDEADGDWLDTWVWSPTSINLTPYLPAGTPVRVAFQYEGQDGAQVGLDAICVTESACGEGFDSQFNGSADGWTGHSGAWYVDSNYSWTQGLADSSSSASYIATYGDFDYQARVWRSGCDTCANRLYFRGTPDPLTSANNWYHEYKVQYARDGQYSVWKRIAGGDAIALQGWTYSSAINQGDAWNTLRVVGNGASLSFYINGTLVWSGSDAALSSGRVGLGMYRSATSTGDLFQADWATLTPICTEGLEPGAVSAEQQALNAAAHQRGGGSEDWAP